MSQMTDFTLPSCVPGRTLHAFRCVPEGEVRAILQLSHGMVEFIDRYKPLAEYLAARGCKVSVIEMMDKIAAGESTTILPTLLENYKTYGVEQYPSHKVKEFRMDAVVCENKDGAEVTIPCDYIVLAMGARSNEFDAAALEAASIPVYSIGDAAGKVDVVVLEQYHIEKSHAVVLAAAELDGHLVEHPHTGRGLARIEHPAVRALQQLHVCGRLSRHAAHALHDIEHDTLRLQERQDAPLHVESDVTPAHARTVLYPLVEGHAAVEPVEDHPRHFDSGDDTVLFDEQLHLPAGIRGNGGERRVVAVADVFPDGKLDELLHEGNVFLFHTDSFIPICCKNNHYRRAAPTAGQFFPFIPPRSVTVCAGIPAKNPFRSGNLPDKRRSTIP